jgi:hypothetical protein
MSRLLDRMDRIKAHDYILPVLVFLLLTIIVYAPLINRLGYYNEDWYHLMMIAKDGPKSLIELYSIDRPFMGYLNYFDVLLVGDNLLAWNIYALICRFLVGVGVYWIMKLVWPKQRFAGFAVAVIVLVYPGFLSEPHAMNYKNYLFEYALALFSIALTIKWVKAEKTGHKVLYALLSILFAGAYVLIYEFMIGLEATRVLLVGYLFWRETDGAWKKTLINTVKYLAAYAATAGAFIYWRFFVFQAARVAVGERDLIRDFIASPLSTLLGITLETGKDFIESVVFAWAVPSYELIGRADYQELGSALLFSALAVVLLLTYFWLIRPFETPERPAEKTSRGFILLGSLSALFSLLAIVIPGRNIQFNGFERYSLHATFGIALLIVGILLALPRKYSVVILIFLTALSTTTHYLNANKWVKIWEGQKTLWWQASWRIPQLEGGTVVIVDYPPNSKVEQDYEIFSPLNLIYSDTDVLLLAEVLNLTTVKWIERGYRLEDSLRGISLAKDFSKVLVMSMPEADSCLHVHDGSNIEFHEYEDALVMLAAPYSQVDLIEVSGDVHVPSEDIFGPEPERGWCYYYQKAALARQQGDWEAVVHLLETARDAGYRAADAVELMPFFEAYVTLGMFDEADEIAGFIKGNEAAAVQLCVNLADAAGYPGGYDAEMVYERLCQ